ncbi:MBL fold metallo-hydrolase [Haloarchaeobius sp. HRN-SO-5]|uniref:MBL fold metallo-hydrolase n=1 Tax=Haloarchaeobius sp. HRN-SO-5 TaxID=3446118 RepID=UPI003EC15297
MVDQITAEELADKLDAGESFLLVDTRPENSYEAWHVRGAKNVPYDPREGVSDEQLETVRELTDGDQFLTICGKGLTSTPFAFDMEEHGFDDVTVVKGGMEDWSKVHEVVPIETGSDDLVLRQIQRRGKGCLGYVVGSRETGEAAVVDVTRQREVYEIAAEEAGLTIGTAVDTHVHADHISGTPALAETLGVPYLLGAGASDRDVEYDYRPVEDGDTIKVGNVELTALHAPGHTTDMVNYLVDDQFLLSADTLFVDSVGRTELQFGDEGAAEGAEQLYDTLHDVILELPDDTRVLPGHVSVTPDGRVEGGTPGEPIEATLGALRERLDLLQLDRETFVDRLVENAPEKPPNYETVIDINTGRTAVESDSEATELELGPNNCAA